MVGEFVQAVLGLKAGDGRMANHASNTKLTLRKADRS
jgi:hypothetical protein